MLYTSIFALLAVPAAGHGYVTKPLSKNAFAHQVRNDFPAGMPQLFRWQPHSSNQGGNRGPPYASGAGSCGADDADYARGLDLWQQWYDSTGTPVPELVPGSDMEVDFMITADHGGQAWLMIACGTEISEEVNWTILERSTDDRQNNFMPSSPGAFAWAMDEFGGGSGGGGGSGTFSAKYHVPASFSCPSNVAVGRYIWKNGNQCNDANNLARKTQTFDVAEFAAIVRAYDPSGRVLGVCGDPNQPQGVEIFISCFDFKIEASSSPSPTSAPTPGCSDSNQYCADWAANGECESNPGFMLDACPASCGACSSPAPTPAPTTPSPPPPTSAPTPGCSDSNQYCADWAANGECESNPGFMLDACPASCGACSTPGPCSDDNQYCEDWAASGQCETNPNYMLETCRKSCGVCSLSAKPKLEARVSLKIATKLV